MPLLNRQTSVTPQRGIPTESRGASASILSISGETVQFFYSNSNTRTQDAGQAAGVAVMGVLSYRPIMNSDGTLQATDRDTSLTFTSTAFTSERPLPETTEAVDASSWADRLSFITADLSNGQYCVDYAKGLIYGKKATTQTTLTSTAYKVMQPSGSVTVDSEFPAATAASDAFANPTTTDVKSFGFSFNGITWDRIRSAVIAVSSTLTGMVNTIPWAIFNTTPTTRATGQGGPLETDSKGNLRVTQGLGGTDTRSTVTPSASSQTLIAANTNRLGLKVVIVTTDPTQKFWFSPGTASSTSFFESYQGSGVLELFDATVHPYHGAWNVISDATTGTIQIWETTP